MVTSSETVEVTPLQHYPRDRPGPSWDARRSGEQTDVSIIIPTFNEGENICHVIPECLRALHSSEYRPEIVVVDDDSDDYTWQHPVRLFGHDLRVRVIRRRTPDNGLAKSVTQGFATASGKYCAVIDADLQHPPGRLPALFDALEEGADVAIGSRYTAGGAIENWTTWRKLVSKGATLCARAVLPDARQVSDPMSGFFAVRRTVAEDIILDPTGYKILLEILGKGDYETVVEVPYEFRERERGQSKLSAEEYLNFLTHLAKLTGVRSRSSEVAEP